MSINTVPPVECGRCHGELTLPLYCQECEMWLCCDCWMPHDVEMMKKQGLLLCPCGVDHQ